jgi:hypothetical protein
MFRDGFKTEIPSYPDTKYETKILPAIQEGKPIEFIT